MHKIAPGISKAGHKDNVCLENDVKKNKSNSTARAVQVAAKSAANIPCLRDFFKQMHNKKMFDLENEGQRSRSTKMTMEPFDDEYQSR